MLKELYSVHIFNLSNILLLCNIICGKIKKIIVNLKKMFGSFFVCVKKEEI